MILSVILPTILPARWATTIRKMAVPQDGADVTLVSGRTALAPPPFVRVVPVVTARDMYEAVTSVSQEQDIIIKAAAVADYRPASVSDEKIKKERR